MRPLLLLALAACGRVGFDARGDDGGDDAHAPDDAGDVGFGQGIQPAACNGAVAHLELGHRDTCLLDGSGARSCAGEDSAGELGLGDMAQHTVFTHAADGDGWDAVHLFYANSYGTRGGQDYAWGQTPASSTPVVTGAAVAHRAWLGGLTLQCTWELDGTLSCDPTHSTWISVDVHEPHQCGIKADHTLWCWGRNYTNGLGQPGMADGVIVPNPMQVGTRSDWAVVQVGGDHMTEVGCALDLAHRLACWGTPTLTAMNGADVGAVPTAVNGDTDWTWLDFNWEHGCAGKPDRSVWCWGDDTYGGEVLIGQPQVLAPTKFGTFDYAVLGGHHTCGLAADRWQCFGYNNGGQLGNGNTANPSQLVDICP